MFALIAKACRADPLLWKARVTPEPPKAPDLFPHPSQGLGDLHVQKLGRVTVKGARSRVSHMAC